MHLSQEIAVTSCLSIFSVCCVCCVCGGERWGGAGGGGGVAAVHNRITILQASQGGVRQG